MLIGAFSLLAVVIACLGILGLAAMSVQHRRKEMGIRKVLGARGHGLMGVFVREYVFLVLIATGIAAIPACLAMSRWLENFAYRTGGVGLSIAGSAFLLMATSIVTVGFQAYRASAVNPAQSLISE